MKLNKKFSELKTVNNYNADEVISAIQKEIRRENFENACYFGLEILESGDIFEKKFWERMLVICVEDVADNNCIIQIKILKDNYFELKNNGSKIWDYQMQAIKAIKILSESKKDRIVSEIYDYLMLKRKENFKIKIPDYAIDMHTKKGKERNLDYLDFLNRSSKIENIVDNKNYKYYNELIKIYRK